MFGQQADEENREVGDRDRLQAGNSRTTKTRESGTGEYTGARAGGPGQQVVEADGQTGVREAWASNQAGPAGE